MLFRAISMTALLVVGMTLGSDAQTTTTFEYDALGRLEAVTSSSGVATAYDYDPMGNRTIVQSSGGVASEGACGVLVVPLGGLTAIPLASCD